MVQGLHEEGQKLFLARDDIEPITIMSANEDESGGVSKPLLLKKQCHPKHKSTLITMKKKFIVKIFTQFLILMLFQQRSLL